MGWASHFIYSQFFLTPPLPITPLNSQVYIITGSNTGLGLAAAAHLARLNCALIILAVRSEARGRAAVTSLVASTGRPASSFAVWPLDLSSFASVRAFGERVAGMERLDAVIQNAGVLREDWVEAEGMESTITINSVGAVLFGMLMLPKLRESARKTGKMGRLSFVGSDLQMQAKFTENQGREEAGLSVLQALGDEKKANMGDRYSTSKLLLILSVRALAQQSPLTPESNVLINLVSPGACQSDLFRSEPSFGMKIVVFLLNHIIGRRTDVGARVLVNGASPELGAEAHGAFIWDDIRSPGGLAEGSKGKALQEEWHKELWAKLESIHPGVTQF
ncbi:NAD(P)-binding protein [Lophium mytilinum]|uniref:NAD(P)-binding protein n=1 Tax=Lophium mytilinum TaxID=390894 RepID=A0A6A6QYS2_9PEZI|nr:NAD(P)-binding protein [Lophium mytilinum]